MRESAAAVGQLQPALDAIEAGLKLGEAATGVALPIYQQREQPALLGELGLDVRYAPFHLREIAADRAQMLQDEIVGLLSHVRSVAGATGECKAGRAA